MKTLISKAPIGKPLTKASTLFPKAPWLKWMPLSSLEKQGPIILMMAPIAPTGHSPFKAPPLSANAFNFNGQSYQLQEHQLKPAPFEAETIYLDINEAWTKTELAMVWDALKTKTIMVYSNHRMVQVTSANKKDLFRYLRKQNYALFPFYKIPKPASALVVSKCNQLTPTLSDLEYSPFLEATSNYFGTFTTTSPCIPSG